ncbi:helix-turn-helix domain-containing protein [Thalassospira lucentensis]|uniref:helix-turn-helix domain-containing protein n=1 Tax=Thalassospira lucentensis TaxID=168935 RepID=UPI003D2F5017
MHYNLRHYRAEAESHSHADFHQIIISDVGKLELEVEGRAGEVSGRRMAFVEAGRSHAFRAEGLNRFLVLDVNINLAHKTGIEALWQSRGRASAYLELQNGAQGSLPGLLDGRWFRPDASEFAGNGMPLTNTIDDSGLVDQIRFILGHSRQAVGTEKDTGSNIPTRLIRVMDWVETRLTEDITISDMARIAAQSESSLFAAFQRYLGTSPMRWLTAKRLQMAWFLLQDCQIQLSIGDLANAVGFSDQSAFSRAFSRQFGQTPVAVRRDARKLPEAEI